MIGWARAARTPGSQAGSHERHRNYEHWMLVMGKETPAALDFYDGSLMGIFCRLVHSHESAHRMLRAHQADGLLTSAVEAWENRSQIFHAEMASENFAHNGAEIRS